MDFSTFRAQPRRERMRVFGESTAEEKAHLVQTQIRTWFEAHRDALSPDQIAILGEHIEYVKPDLWRFPRTKDTSIKDELIARTAALFGIDQMMQALTITSSDCPDYPESPVELRDIPNSSHLMIDVAIVSAFCADVTVRIRVYSHDVLADRAVLLTPDPKQGSFPNPALVRITDLLPVAGPSLVGLSCEAELQGSRLWLDVRITDPGTGDVRVISPAGERRPSCE